MSLNRLQQDVAEALDEHILLTASAGTGKTNTLAYRISNILKRGLAQPQEILCLTFTNKACNEMQERVLKLANTDEVVIRTFHSFCYDVIRTESKGQSDISWDSQIFDETDSQVLLDIVMENLNKANAETPNFVSLKWPEMVYRNLVEYAKMKRAEMDIFTDDELADYTKIINALYDDEIGDLTKKCYANGYLQQQIPQEFLQWGAKLVTEYNRQLKETHGMDFSDLVVWAHRLLKDKEIQTRWSQQFKFINIDEMQDTSPLEYDIIQRIFGDSKILLCGDFFQTIFQWRGSDPEIIISRFEKEYKPRRVIFDRNYRATRLLVNSSFAVLSELFPEGTKAFYPNGILAAAEQEGDKILLYRAASDWTQARWIYHELHNKWKEQGDSFLQKVCILTRSNFRNKQLSVLFEKIGDDYEKKNEKTLPFMLVDDFKFFRRQEIKDSMAFLRLLMNKNDAASMKRIIKRFVKGVGKASIDAIESDSYRQAGIKLTDFIDPVSYVQADPYGMLINQLHKGNVVVFDVEATGLDTDRDEIIQLAAIRIDEQGKVLDKFVKYLRASRRVGMSEKVHHISDEKLRQEGEKSADVLRGFCEFARNSVVVGHNVTFDMTILTSQLRRLNLPAFEPMGVYDTLDIFRRFYPELPNHKLEFLGEYCNVQHKSSHDAYDDICATGEILIYAVDKNLYPTADMRRQYIGRLLDRFKTISDKMIELRKAIDSNVPLKKVVADILMNMGLVDYYKSSTVELDENDGRGTKYSVTSEDMEKDRKGRVENLRQLIRHARSIEGQCRSTREAAEKLLKLSSLSNAEIETNLKENPKIPILTVHQVKGSEFDYVYLADCYEGVFPSNVAIKQNELTEEARLFYVTVTRAKKQLIISYPVNKRPCRYIRSIPAEYVTEL